MGPLEAPREVPPGPCFVRDERRCLVAKVVQAAHRRRVCRRGDIRGPCVTLCGEHVGTVSVLGVAQAAELCLPAAGAIGGGRPARLDGAAGRRLVLQGEEPELELLFPHGERRGGPPLRECNRVAAAPLHSLDRLGGEERAVGMSPEVSGRTCGH